MGRTTRPARADSPMADDADVEKSFCLSKPDGWVVNRKMKKIISFLNSKGQVKEKIHGSWRKCLRAGFQKPVEGKRDRWVD